MPAATVTHAYCERVTATPTSPIHLRQVGTEGLKLGGGIPEDVAALCGATIARGWDLPTDVPSTVERAATIPQDQPGRHCLRCIEQYTGR